MTAYSKSALTTLLADNTSGDISASDVRGIVDSTLGCYGALYVANSVATQSLTTTPAKITMWATDGLSDNTTVANANDSITVLITGVYQIHASITGHGSNTDVYTFTPNINGTAVTGVQARVTNSGSNIATASFCCLVSLTANDVITVYGSSDQLGGSTYNYKDGQLCVVRVG